MKKLLFIAAFILVCMNVMYGQKKGIKDTSLVSNAVLASCPQSLLGCNFNNWPNPLKGSAITYSAPVNGNCYDGTASTQWECISTQANQTWFYVRIITSGNIRFVFNNSSGVDVDGILWGPIANGDISQACSISQTTPLFCDYSVSPTVELPCTTHSDLCGGTVPSTLAVQAGQIYVMCILNYANQPTNITIGQPIGGSVYYSQESQQIQIEHFKVNNGNISNRVSLKNAGSEDSGVFKVCADGAISSLFKINTTIPNLKARIAQDPFEINTSLYGKFAVSSFSNGVYEITFKHPDYIADISQYTQYNIELYSNDNPSVVVSSYPLRVHPAPLLMVHGLWSKGTPLDASCFVNLEQELSGSSAYNINTNIVTTKLFRQANYFATNDATFATNSGVVPNYLSSLINYLTSEGYAVSKCDILGHSMGGILSRQYLQSNQYQNNIHKLMTLNTPHSGSQMANFLANPLNTGDALCEYIREIMSGNPSGASCQSGAVTDLGVNSSAIATLNNGTGLVKVVPSHAIATTFPSDVIADGLSRVSKVGVIAELISIGLSIIFQNEDNDLVVPLSSQKGGLPTNAFSQPSFFAPHSSQGFSSVIEQVKYLLGEPTSSSVFTMSGFNPPVLSYGIPSNNVMASTNNATINIAQPVNNIRINRGNDLVFQISATNVTGINVAIDYDEDEVISYKTASNTANFTVYIDNEFAIGKHNVIAVGKTSNGSTVSQKISFEVVDCVGQYNPLEGNLTQSYYQAEDLIITNGQIPFGQNIQMTAGKSIELKPGFVTDPYTIFSAKINNCNN
jgi:PGAP1-like protein